MDLQSIWQQVERFNPAHAMIGEIFMPDIAAIPYTPARLKPFFVSFPFTLAAGQTLEASQNLYRDYFVLAVMGSSTGSLRVWFQDAQSRQPNQVTPVYSTAVLGTGAKPHWLRRPYYVSPASAINVKVVDTSGAANEVTVTLHGAVVI